MYFRNKFDPDFLRLCNEQEPKGGKIRLDSEYHTFWLFRRRNLNFPDKKKKNRPNTVHVIPLLLFDTIESTNILEDKNVEDYMMICADKSDTTITCEYKGRGTSQQSEEHICTFGVEEITGDLSSNERLEEEHNRLLNE